MNPRHRSGCPMSDGFSSDMGFLIRPKRAKFLSVAILSAILALATPAHAQGCAQCLDNTAATSPVTQRAYRHAILLMSAAAATFFAVTLILFKRNP